MAIRKISLFYSLFHGKFLRDIGNGDKTENFQISIILRLGYQKSLICKFLSISLFLFCFKPSLTLQLHFLHIFCIDSKLCTTTTAITIQWLNFPKCVSIHWILYVLHIVFPIHNHLDRSGHVIAVHLLTRSVCVSCNTRKFVDYYILSYPKILD